MRVLITGVTGFAGGHLAEALLGTAELHGVSRAGRWPEPLIHLERQIPLHGCDLADSDAVEGLLRRLKPDRIYHLAGFARVAESFRQPNDAWRDNLGATLSLYRAIERWGGRPRVLFVSSGLVYGTDGPCGPATPLAPASPYAAAKAAADLLSYQVTRHPGLDVVRVRPFNQIGPRQSPDFAVARFARQLARIEAGLLPPVLETGDLRPSRDLTDVRDMVEAYRLLMESGRTGRAYTVGRGRVVSMQNIVDRLVKLTRRPVQVRQKLELFRPTDVHAARADASDVHDETGWSPRRPLDETLAEILDYWRADVEKARLLASA
jgi:GDP-4-dehydro-6-deoxy-D-mannose reductase